MSTVTQLVDQTDIATLTSDFLTCAATLERRLHDQDREIACLNELLRQVVSKQAVLYEWIVRLRRSHRTKSHAHTARMFKHVIKVIEPEVPLRPRIDARALLTIIKTKVSTWKTPYAA